MLINSTFDFDRFLPSSIFSLSPSLFPFFFRNQFNLAALLFPQSQWIQCLHPLNLISCSCLYSSSTTQIYGNKKLLLLSLFFCAIVAIISMVMWQARICNPYTLACMQATNSTFTSHLISSHDMVWLGLDWIWNERIEELPKLGSIRLIWGKSWLFKYFFKKQTRIPDISFEKCRGMRDKLDLLCRAEPSRLKRRLSRGIARAESSLSQSWRNNISSPSLSLYHIDVGLLQQSLMFINHEKDWIRWTCIRHDSKCWLWSFIKLNGYSTQLNSTQAWFADRKLWHEMTKLRFKATHRAKILIASWLGSAFFLGSIHLPNKLLNSTWNFFFHEMLRRRSDVWESMEPGRRRRTEIMQINSTLPIFESVSNKRKLLLSESQPPLAKLSELQASTSLKTSLRLNVHVYLAWLRSLSWHGY